MVFCVVAGNRPFSHCDEPTLHIAMFHCPPPFCPPVRFAWRRLLEQGPSRHGAVGRKTVDLAGYTRLEEAGISRLALRLHTRSTPADHAIQYVAMLDTLGPCGPSP